VDRAEKREQVAQLNSLFNETSVVVVAHYSGLTVNEMGDLRRRMAGAGASFKVIKNRLAKLALKDTKCDPISDLFKGPAAIAFSSDPVAAPKIAAAFAKEKDKFIIIGGIVGNTVLNADGVKQLASLPSIDELRGKILGLLNAPAQRIASVLAAPGGQVARVIKAHADQQSSAA